MTPEEKERMAVLVQRIQLEQDQKKFNDLVSELNTLLSDEGKQVDRLGTQYRASK